MDPPVKDSVVPGAPRKRWLQALFDLRQPAPLWQVRRLQYGVSGRIRRSLVVSDPRAARWADRRYSVLPSPAETFSSFHELWFDRALTRNTLVTLKRVTLGFGLAAAIGIPVGVLCGCFSWVNAFFLPPSLFGRNIPLAALIGLTYAFFGIQEQQKVMFICLACVAFILSDTAGAIQEVGGQYVDTAYTLGASRLQIIFKVLIPLAMPSVFNSLRLLFGLAFGYIMLAETIKLGSESGGLGDIINTSMRRGRQDHVILTLIIIPIVALAIDRVLFWVQRELFPHRFGGIGILNQAVRAILHGWEDLKGLIFRRSAAAGDPPASVPP